MDYEHLKQKLEEAKLFFQPPMEKTIFSIGGKGYYENPISDLLAFFFNPQEEHAFGMLFLDSLFGSLGLKDIPQSLDLIGIPKREVSTENGKRIDILLEGDDWVLIIENKIYHHQVNPFKEYEKFINNNYKGKKAIFVILSPGGNSALLNWIPLSYKTFVQALKVSLGKIVIENQYSKWFVFLRDFILNIEQYAVRNDMDKKAIDFIESNYQDVNELVKLRESYINHVQKVGLNKLKTLFPTQNITTAIHNWGHGPAIRFYSDSWVSKSNLVIQLSHRESDKGIGIYIYVYKIPESDVENTDKKLQKDYHKKPWTESKTIRCYKSDNRFDNYNDLLPEFEETAKNFNEFNINKKT